MPRKKSNFKPKARSRLNRFYQAALKNRLSILAIILTAGPQAIGMTVLCRALSGQDISTGSTSESAGKVVSVPRSDIYFSENSTDKTPFDAKPQRDPGSITAPSIPGIMDVDIETPQKGVNQTANDDFGSFSGETGIRTTHLQQPTSNSSHPFAESPFGSMYVPDTGSFRPQTTPQQPEVGRINQQDAPVFNTPFQRQSQPDQYDLEQLQSVANGHPVGSLPPLPAESLAEPNLELSSRFQLADPASQRQLESQSRELFWDQFSTQPDWDRYGRAEGYDSLPAILHNGFWFAGVDVFFFEPVFQNNNAITTTGNGASTSVAADYNFDAAWKGYLGFETNAGPAIKASFFRYNEFSAPVSFVSDGISTGESIVQTGDPANVFRIGAINAGDRIETRQQIKLNSIDLLFYKNQNNAHSTLRGNAGIRFLSLQQFLFADLSEPAGSITSLRSVNDLQAMGPKLGIEYFRPMIQGNLEFQTGFFGSMMFGRRDHIVTDVGNLQFRQIGKTVPLAIFEMYLGVQWNFRIAKCRTGFVRTALESQYWTNGASPVDTGTDFGFYGLSAGFGVQR